MTTPSIHPSIKPIVWTIAGSDSGGGAGIQADLHTFQDFNLHSCSVITAVTAQNSLTVEDLNLLSPAIVASQINALAKDMPPKAIKLGMLGDTTTVSLIIDYLKDYKGFVVYDPVMCSSSDGKSLLNKTALALMTKELLPRVDLLSPNISEASALSDLPINNTQDVIKAAEKIIRLGARSVLLTGGHLQAQLGRRLDYWTNGKQSFWLTGEDIDNDNNHGSGCTLSSAITALIAHDFSLADAMVLAKAYVTRGIRHGVKIGEGAGPVAHNGWPQKLCDLPILTSALEQTDYSFPSCDGPLGLYPVVDSSQWIAKLLPLGITTIQLRIKAVSDVVARQEISAAIKLCKAKNVRLFINDYWALAIELGAYGVHLGQEDLDTADLTALAKAGIRLGISTHSYYEIARAHGINPSYIAIGPVYSTTTKVMKFSALGLSQLQQWVDLLRPQYHLTAIGGISVSRAKEVLKTGVTSCAVVSAITEAEDYVTAVKQLNSLFQD